MIISSAKFKKRSCFIKSWAGFDEFKDISIIIGRNNTGKSRLIDLVKHLCINEWKNSNWELSLKGILDEESLQCFFLRQNEDGQMVGNHWIKHGRYYVGKKISWETHRGRVKNLGVEHEQPISQRTLEARERVLKLVVLQSSSPYEGFEFRHLLADRDVQPEPKSASLELSPGGVGATNIVRRHISSSTLPRELIQVELLDALNTIFEKDGCFSEIQVQEHDSIDGEHDWEVFLGEESKGLVALSQSGSGLKTIFLVLLNLLVVPRLANKSRNKFVFAFEELENNLHPALQRRLIGFINSYSQTEGAKFFLTTHSSVALDFFSRESRSQTIHVTHNGESAATNTITAHFDRAGVASELGAKPSDLLQANGVIWVEGPSDRVYLNSWIRTLSEELLEEGSDYQIAYYGGALLATVQFSPPESQLSDLSNLLRINGNIAVICDSDRTSTIGKGSRLKNRVRRIKAEVEQVPDAFLWVTDAKEIENYLTLASLQGFGKKNPTRPPGLREAFFPTNNSKEKSYIESELGRKSVDKMKLAVHAASLFNKTELKARSDVAEKVGELIKSIRSWR